MKNLNKIFKWSMVLLIVLTVAILVMGFVGGWKEGNVDVLLLWAYIMVGLAIAAVVIVGLILGIKNNPKSLVKMGIGLGIFAVLCFIAYLIAPGSPAIDLNQDQPSQAMLKFTDTILSLTYFAGAAAIIAIIVGEIRLAITNKKG